MKVEYSKAFEKAVRKLSGKYLESLREVILEVKEADSIEDITDCRKLVGFDNIYRIRMGGYRAFFYLKIIEDTVYFQYFLSRGEAYKKEVTENLQKIDRKVNQETDNIKEAGKENNS